MVSIRLNSKRRRFEDPAEIASTSTNPCNKNEVQSPATPDPMVGVSGSKNEERDQLFGNDMKQIHLDDVKLKPVIAKFVSGLGALASSIQVEAFHVNRFSSVYEKKLQSFNLLAKSMMKKCNDNAYLKVCWYGPSKEEVVDIITNGFVRSSYRHGVQLSAFDYPLDCLQTAIQDKDGLRHLLIFHVIVGKIEVVTPGSGQFQPSSQDLDSGVDNLLCPRKYFVWNCHLNTHIFLLGIISFRVSPHSERVEKCPTLSKNVNLRIFTDDVVTELSKILPPQAIKMITVYFNDYLDGKITMQEFVRQVREVAGSHAFELITVRCKDYRYGKITMQEFARQVSEVAGNNVLIELMKSLCSAKHT